MLPPPFRPLGLWLRPLTLGTRPTLGQTTATEPGSRNQRRSRRLHHNPTSRRTTLMGVAAPVTSYESKQYYQTSTAPAQRTPTETYYQTGAKPGYSQASTVYSQPPPPQRQVTTLKPIGPTISVSTSYNIYPVSTSVQQPPTPISSYAPSSSYNSTAATSYSAGISYSTYDTSGYTSTPSYYQPAQLPPHSPRPPSPRPIRSRSPNPLSS
ncbi:hypothetical protein GJAV_G00074350 [Gymnothorax javanicus]|nr:hypothetical protein GJAV_G00074350 [Gymnothorax javanicus]